MYLKVLSEMLISFLQLIRTANETAEYLKTCVVQAAYKPERNAYGNTSFCCLEIISIRYSKFGFGYIKLGQGKKKCNQYCLYYKFLFQDSFCERHKKVRDK